MIDRLNLDGSKQPNFIGCWMMKDKSICDRLVEFFECNEALQHAGLVGDGMPNEKIKKLNRCENIEVFGIGTSFMNFVSNGIRLFP